MPLPHFLLFYAPEGASERTPAGASEAEALVDAARVAVVRDTALRARRAGFETVVIATTTPEPFADLEGVVIDAEARRAPFGARLQQILDRYRPAAICYAGAGMPALTARHWSALRRRLERAPAAGATSVAGAGGGLTVVNNLYSTDVLATTRVEALAGFPAAARDNALGLYLRDVAGLGAGVEVQPRSAATLLDLDTPAEVRLLALAGEAGTITIGPNLRAVLAAARPRLGLEPLGAAIDALTDREREVLVAGRVSSAVWEALERETACRVRVIAEERGMSSRARAPRSLLGLHLEATGPEAIVEAIAELADVAFLDTRPLFGHLGWDLRRADRFAADLAMPAAAGEGPGASAAVQHPALRAFVAAVERARIPLVLGGHALVTGGLLAAIDIAWARWEQRGGAADR